MPSLGTLVTVVTADTSGFTSGMNTAAQQTQQFAAKVNASSRESTETMSRWGQEVEHLGSKFTSLHGLLAIGFGVHLGRALFSEIHKGVMELASGFTEGMKAGEGFFDSIGEGLRKVAGMETHIEGLNKRIVENRKLAKEVGAAATAVEGSDTPRGAAKVVDVLQEKQKDFDEKAAIGRQKISDLEARLVQAQEIARRPLGEFAQSRSEPADIQKQIDAAQKEYSGVIQAAIDHEKDLNAAREKLSRMMDQQAAPIRAKELLFGGYGNIGYGLQQTAEGMFHQIADPIKSTFAPGLEFAGDAVKKFGEAVISGANTRALYQKGAEEALQEKMRDEQDIQNKRLEEKRKLENMPAQAHIGGLTDLHNALQMAALGPKTDKDLEELKKHTQHLKDANDKLKALNDKATPLVWA